MTAVVGLCACATPKSNVVRSAQAQAAYDRVSAQEDALIARLTHAMVLEVLSLDPDTSPPSHAETESAPAKGPQFHDWRYIERSTSVSERDGRALLSDLRIMLRSRPDYMALCFNPRHALRVATSTGELDVLVCFECGIVEIYDPPNTFLINAAFWGGNEKLWYSAFARSGIKVQKYVSQPRSGI
jgi:hypothetical protein